MDMKNIAASIVLARGSVLKTIAMVSMGLVFGLVGRTMTISHGDISVFVTRPISAGLLAVTLVVLVVAFLPNIARRRNQVFVEED